MMEPLPRRELLPNCLGLEVQPASLSLVMGRLPAYYQHHVTNVLPYHYVEYLVFFGCLSVLTQST